VNVILARRKTVGISRQRHDSRENVLDDVGARVERPDLGVDFEVAMATLPVKAKQVFVLHDVEGYTHEEIATMLDIVPGTSKSQLHHARMALRRHLRD
jgi:RNA polymerase sigma-70 factor (ECF subfamily)